MNVWYINSMLGTLRLEEEDDALCAVQLCPDGGPDLEPLPRKVCETPLLQETEEQLNEYFAGAPYLLDPRFDILSPTIHT